MFRTSTVVQAAVGTLLCATAHIASAQAVFLCKGVDGKQQYQDAPCAATAEVETQWSKDRAREKAREDARKAEAAKRDAAEASLYKNAPSVLKRCAEDKDCTIDMIRGFMLRLGKQDLIDAFGPPDTIQSVGDYWYFTVVGEEAGARRRVRLQVEFMQGHHPLTKNYERIVYKVNVF